MNDQETIALTQQLVRIDSVNPSLVPGAAGENEIAHFIQDFAREHGIDALLEEALPGRPNVVARLPGKGAGRSLLLCCHMDTVSVEGMEEPFSARIDDGRLYGRGSQDVKGGLSAMLSAGIILANAEPLDGEVVLAAVADEEAYSAGTEALLANGVRADGAIIFEPTDLDIAIAHKGFLWVRVETQGVAAHGSRPAEGVDAIAHMGSFLKELADHDAALRSGEGHPLVGTGSVHASLIDGGRELSSYPDQCRLDLERRTIPGEKEEQVVAGLVALLDRLRATSPDFRATMEVRFSRPAFEIARTEPVPATLRKAIAKTTGRTADFAGMTGWTDSALLQQAGIPAVVFGPGGAGLHGLDEWGKVEEICSCRDALVEMAQSFCRLDEAESD